LQKAISYQEVYLPSDLFIAAVERLFILHAESGDFSAAIKSFERLRDASDTRAEGYPAAIARMEPIYKNMFEIVEGPRTLGINARVGEHGYWVHNLLRRSFAFDRIQGQLEVLDLRCARGNKRYSPVVDGNVWTIPQSWGECGVYVKGAEGTTFVFLEYPKG
jgi:hypothetical protein